MKYIKYLIKQWYKFFELVGGSITIGYFIGYSVLHYMKALPSFPAPLFIFYFSITYLFLGAFINFVTQEKIQ